MEKMSFVSVPFTRELRIEQRYKVDFLEQAILTLQATCEARQSGVLIGPAGAGKSVVLRALVDILPAARYRPVYLKLAHLGARDMCRQIAIGLGLSAAGQYPALVRALEEKLHSGLTSQGLRQVLIFDDAHEMRPEALRLVRLLTNFEMDSKLVTTVILAGQLPLKKILMASELEDVRQRLNASCELRLLSREETKAYLTHRVKIAGCSRSLFATDATEAIYEITQGNMRAIDKMAFAALRATDAAGLEIVSASEVAAARAGQWM